MSLPLEGLLVVSIEQAVAAPHCTCHLADAGARVIKVERPEGDFARRYDHIVHGESAHFVWLNRGKQSVVLDLGKADDKALLEAMLAKADVFVQNLKPGAIAKLGFAVARLRKDYPRLICCSISGYGESGPYAQRKAYDLLIQAESGLSSVTGGPEAPARVGVSVVDIAAGLERLRSDPGSAASSARAPARAPRFPISMFDAMAEWMTIPLLNQEGGNPFKRIGLAHPTIAPYGVFKTRDGADILISIQNDREWRVLADKVLGDAALGTRSRNLPPMPSAPAASRRNRRARSPRCSPAYDVEPLMQKLAAADIAFARVNDQRIVVDASASAPRSPSIRRAARSACRRRRRNARKSRAAMARCPRSASTRDMISKEFAERDRATRRG